jgi:quercetin dioxygenase-like cupin family protein
MMAIRVSVQSAAIGETEQMDLASGARVAMWLWRDLPEGQPSPPKRLRYETAGFVVSGRALLQTGGDLLQLRKGDSWVVPAEVEHACMIQEPFTAIEATSPPASVLARDDATERFGGGVKTTQN